MEGLTQDQTRKEAQELYRAEREKTTLRPLTEKYPKIEPQEAYQIQLALIEMKRADGLKVVGKKIGLTSKAMQKMLNVDQSDYGHILDNMVLQDAAVFPAGELIQPKIEPEIAFILDQNLKGPGVTAIQVLAATRFVVPALEIIDSRIEGWKIRLCDTIADNASSARVVLGSSPKRIDQLDLKLVGMVLEKNGEIVQTGRLDLVQVIEDAGLVGTDLFAAFRIPDMTGVAGKKDPRIELHHLPDSVHALILSILI